MSHDPAGAAAAYLAGELAGSEHEAFEGHLLSCDECWNEVHAGRLGRRYAVAGRELAPASLRRWVLDTLPSADDPAWADPTAPGRTARRLPATGGRPGRRRLPVPVLVVAAVVMGMIVGAATVLLATRQHSEQPEPIAAAVAAYRDDRLPGAQVPHTAAPDLSGLRLAGTAAAGGQLDGLPVTAYVYRDDGGRRLFVYIGARPFPVPYEPEELGRGTLWVSHEDGVTILCGQRPRHTLIVGEDEALVRAAAQTMRMS